MAQAHSEANITTRTDNNTDSRGANRQSCTGEGKRKGTSREVPQLGKGCTGSVHHLSGSGRATCQCWGPIGHRPILGRKSILGTGLFLGERSVLGTCPFLERKTYFWSMRNRWQESKHAKKEGKEHAGGKATWARMQTGLTMLGLGFLTNIVMNYKPIK
jgi:hypothetical protein